MTGGVGRALGVWAGEVGVGTGRLVTLGVGTGLLVTLEVGDTVAVGLGDAAPAPGDLPAALPDFALEDELEGDAAGTGPPSCGPKSGAAPAENGATPVGAATARVRARATAVARPTANPNRTAARLSDGRSPVFWAERAKTWRVGVRQIPSAHRPHTGAET